MKSGRENKTEPESCTARRRSRNEDAGLRCVACDWRWRGRGRRRLQCHQCTVHQQEARRRLANPSRLWMQPPVGGRLNVAKSNGHLDVECGLGSNIYMRVHPRLGLGCLGHWAYWAVGCGINLWDYEPLCSVSS